MQSGLTNYYPAARELYEECLRLRREMGDKLGMAMTLNNLGNLTIEQGDFSAARSAYRESLELCQAMGNKIGMLYNLSGLGAVAAHLGDLARAARLAQAAETLRLSLNIPWERVEGRIYEQTLATTRVGLSEADFHAARSIGEKMTPEEAVIYALEER